MNTDLRFRSKRPLPLIMLLAAVGIGFYLSVPISGFGDKDDLEGVTEGHTQAPLGLNTERAVQRLKDELDTERQEMARIEKELFEEKEYSQDLLRSVQRYRELAAMTDLLGSGIILTIDEITGRVPNEKTGFIIHQQDLLEIINELWHNGAEAVAVGSKAGSGALERITTFSPVRCSGGAIEVNDERMVPPFEIRAIGDPDLLETVLKMRGGYLEKLNLLNIYTKIETSDDVYIPKYSGTTMWLHARSIFDGGKIVLSDEGEEGTGG